MAIQPAATAKTNSETYPPDYTDIYDSLIATVINDEITAQGLLGKFRSIYEFERREQDNKTEIKQSDDTWISLGRLVLAMEAKGYRTSFTIKNGAALQFTVAWS